MIRRDVSLTIALCASLVAHALLLGSAAELYSDRTRIWLPGFAQQPANLSALLIPRDDEQDPWHRLGDSEGTGKSILDTPGDVPLEAQKASQDQPFLSLDPAGPGKVGDDPTDSMLPPGSGGPAAPAHPADQPAPQPAPAVLIPPPQPALASATPPPSATPLGLSDSRDELDGPFVKSPSDGPADQTPKVQTAPGQSPEDSATAETPAPMHMPPDQTPTQLATVAPAQPAAASDSGSGQPTAADPAPQGDSESDPTSTVGAAKFRAGATEVRIGRKFKITRPHLSLAAQADLVTQQTHSLILKLKIDEAGNITSAEVYRSSGSNSIDQPCKLAAYKWWFEPLKDAKGKPVKDVILFTIGFI